MKVEEISQTIDSENFTVQNSVQFAGPLTTTSITTNAKFEVRSPKRVQVHPNSFLIYLDEMTNKYYIQWTHLGSNLGVGVPYC